MTTAMVVDIRPAQPIRRLAAPSSASTKDSALSSASSETATTSSLGNELSGGGLGAAMLSPERSYTARRDRRGPSMAAHSCRFGQSWQGYKVRLWDDDHYANLHQRSLLARVDRRRAPVQLPGEV